LEDALGEVGGVDEGELFIARADVGEDAEALGGAEEGQEVGVARAVDAGGTDDGDGEAVGGLEDEAFAGEFGGAVEVVGMGWGGFVLGFGGGVGADGGEGGDVDEALEVFGGGGEDAGGGVGVGGQVFGKGAAAGEAGDVEEVVGLGQGGIDGVEFDGKAGEGRGVGGGAGEADDVEALGEEALDEVAADESGGTCDEGDRGGPPSGQWPVVFGPGTGDARLKAVLRTLLPA
jgi:hypothetical protein